MSLDSLTSLMTIIPLGTTPWVHPYITDMFVSRIREYVERGEKVMVYYNRRGASRAWICEDCGHFERCPHCDIAFSYHTSPQSRLVCHQCNAVAPAPDRCPRCSSTRRTSVGLWIQQVESGLAELLGTDYHIARIDSDVWLSPRKLRETADMADVILTTSMGVLLQDHHIRAVFFPFFEVNLSIPDYEMEEKLFHEVNYFKKQGKDLYIQTYIPDHPLLDIILHGNYRSFLQYLEGERKLFQYPPFGEFVTLRIHDEKRERVSDMMARLVNKISLLRKETTFFAFDHDLWERHAGEWVQKIILKDHSLEYILGILETEIVRNRSVTLDRT